MAGELKEMLTVLSDVIGKLPDMALWILLGFGLFKLTILLSTTGSLLYGFKLLITRAFDWMDAKRERPKEVSVDKMFITSDGTFHQFLAAIVRIKNVTTPTKSIGSDYIHGCDVGWLNQAIDMKLEYDKENKLNRFAE